MFEVVFFDLDGILVDMVLDFYVVFNQLLCDYGWLEVSYQVVCVIVFNGGWVFIELGFGLVFGDVGFDEWFNELFDVYGGCLVVDICLFDGMVEILSWLEDQGLFWGVIINKLECFICLVFVGLGLFDCCVLVICLDQVCECKLDLEGLLMVVGVVGVNFIYCVYVGDYLCDIQVGFNVKMIIVIVGFGYIDVDDNLCVWLVDYFVECGE